MNTLESITMTENLYCAVQAMAGKLYKIHKSDLKYENMIDALHMKMQDEYFNSKLAEWPSEFSLGGALHTSFTSKIMLLPETVIDGLNNHHKIHKNHFMMQIFRMPLQETCSILNLLTIACYTGILSSCLKVDDFPEGIVKAYKALNIHSSVCYIDPELFNKTLLNIPLDFQADCLKVMVDACRI